MRVSCGGSYPALSSSTLGRPLEKWAMTRTTPRAASSAAPSTDSTTIVVTRTSRELRPPARRLRLGAFGPEALLSKSLHDGDGEDDADDQAHDRHGDEEPDTRPLG